MKNKFLLTAFTTLLGLAMPLMFTNNEAHAFTITDDGKYALIMNLKISDDDGNIDGLPGKVLKFNFDDGEEKVKLYDLTKGVVAFNGRNEFSGWALSSESNEPAPENTEFTPEDFTSSGYNGDVSYEKGKSVYALFTGKEISETEKYYLQIDPFGGKVQGKDTILLSFDPEKFQTVDLSKYIAERDDCIFCGWGSDGKIVTSIDKSYFAENNVVIAYALYKKTTFYGVDEKGRLNNTDLPEDDRPYSYVLKLDANGGTIDGEKIKSYDYLGGKDSGTAMPIFHYIPQRKGCTFKGWNSKKDGSGKDYNLIYWQSWRTDSDNDLDKEFLAENERFYTHLTLYANWEGTPIEDEENNNEIPSSDTSDVKGSITFEDSIGENYTLEIEEIEIPQDLTNKDVKFLVDINLLLNNTEAVQVNGKKMKIKIALPEELKGFNNYKVVYIENGEIKETFPATVADGHITFETTHLSQYGVVATNNEENLPADGENENGNNNENNGNKNNGNNQNKNNGKENENTDAFTENPVTGDAITGAMILFAITSFGMAAFPALNKKK